VGYKNKFNKSNISNAKNVSLFTSRPSSGLYMLGVKLQLCRHWHGGLLLKLRGHFGNRSNRLKTGSGWEMPACRLHCDL